jgi:FixJ family two-component response regulator
MQTTSLTKSRSDGVARSLVAIVDDDTSFLRSLGRLLRSAGYAVETFCSASKFLSAFPALSAQCLVLDVHMPEMTGLQLRERLADLGFCAPVIFVTANDTPETRDQARRAGSHGLLVKPFDQEVLLSAIHSALNPSGQNA